MQRSSDRSAANAGERRAEIRRMLQHLMWARRKIAVVPRSRRCHGPGRIEEGIAAPGLRTDMSERISASAAFFVRR